MMSHTARNTTKPGGTAVFTDWNGVMAELFDLDTSLYTVDSANQDSSSGIASDEHNTASATSESSPTYDLIDSKIIPTKLSSKYRNSQRRDVESPQHSGYESDYVDLSEVAKRGYGGHRRRLRQYHETDLDDPSTDCTFVFPERLGPQTRNCDSAPPLASTPTRHLDTPTRHLNTPTRHLTTTPHAKPAQNHTHNHAIQHLRSKSDAQTVERTQMDYGSYITEYGLKRKHKRSHFDLLPDDIIVKIFQHLTTDQLCRCARACLRWYNLVWDPILWTTIHINDSTVDVDRALRVLTRRLSHETPTVCAIVEKINLNGCSKLTDKGLYTIARRCSELRHLDVQGCVHITNIALFEVVSNCVNMEHLNVAGCADVTCICLTPEATVQAATYGKQIYLHYLDMTDCYNLDDSGIQMIASYCTKLTHIYLRRCSKISDIGVQYIANYCTNLKEFSISDCRNITDFGLRELSKLGNNLRYLSVAKCDKISDVGIRYIARFCTKLRYLNVRGCEAVSDDSIEMLARCCTRLRSLDVGKCDITDDGLESLSRYCKQLRKLSLKSCDAISDVGLVQLAQHCRGLLQLNIQDCHVTVDAYRTVKRYCKRCIIEHTNPGFY